MAASRLIKYVMEKTGKNEDKSDVQKSAPANTEHPVTKLKELCMARGLGAPSYVFTRTTAVMPEGGWMARCAVGSGPDAVEFDGDGKNKKEAKKVAAQRVYDVVVGRPDLQIAKSGTGEPVHVGGQSSVTASTVDTPTCTDGPGSPMDTSSSPLIDPTRRNKIVAASSLYLPMDTSSSPLIDPTRRNKIVAASSLYLPMDTISAGLKRKIFEWDPDFAKPLTKKQKKY